MMDLALWIAGSWIAISVGGGIIVAVAALVRGQHDAIRMAPIPVRVRRRGRG
jgi:hypothetical protein